MTTHEFAKQLLEAPNIPVVVPKVIQYEDGDEDCCASPVLTVEDGFENDMPARIAVISYAR